jgi:hypothetical protein
MQKEAMGNTIMGIVSPVFRFSSDILPQAEWIEIE